MLLLLVVLRLTGPPLYQYLRADVRNEYRRTESSLLTQLGLGAALTVFGAQETESCVMRAYWPSVHRCYSGVYKTMANPSAILSSPAQQ